MRKTKRYLRPELAELEALEDSLICTSYEGVDTEEWTEVDF